MAAVSVNSLMQAISKNQPYTPATKMPILERNHYSGPSSGGGGYHPSYGHSHSSSHGSGKHSIALTALTLLAFLFFLNILQNCLEEHMESMNPEQQQQQIIILKSRTKEAKEAQKRKSDDEQTLFVNASSTADKDLQQIWKSTKPSNTKSAYGMEKKLNIHYENKKP